MTSTSPSPTLRQGAAIDLGDINITFINTPARGFAIDIGYIDITFANTLARGSTIDLGDLDITALPSRSMQGAHQPTSIMTSSMPQPHIWVKGPWLPLASSTTLHHHIAQSKGLTCLLH
jgi:hypothetical protein